MPIGSIRLGWCLAFPRRPEGKEETIMPHNLTFREYLIGQVLAALMTNNEYQHQSTEAQTKADSDAVARAIWIASHAEREAGRAT